MIEFNAHVGYFLPGLEVFLRMFFKVIGHEGKGVESDLKSQENFILFSEGYDAS